MSEKPTYKILSAEEAEARDRELFERLNREIEALEGVVNQKVDTSKFRAREVGDIVRTTCLMNEQDRLEIRTMKNLRDAIALRLQGAGN
ncbi:hypothetical protein JW752_02995 [Candidatus Peregrinibacteria bacterium]|nr:hypothetical protein [Candidatus Peregrinibacteria bacterium]